MVKTFVNLVSDFRKSLGSDYAAVPLQKLLQGGIQEFRKYKFPGRARVSPSVFKREYQLEMFFKRYRFENDVYSDDELNAMSVEKFIDTQKRLDSPIVETPLINRVLRDARSHAKRILRVYDKAEHQTFCRFGKRACVGTTLTSSYLDEKLKNLTGSHEHIRWFKDYLRTDELLRSAIREASGKKRPQYIMCDTLTMSHVPKTFKALRAICPDTLLGSFYTAGLGGYIADRLKEEGLDIRTLQRRHGILAMKASESRTLVTADLSAASDSLTLFLLRRVLPSPWYRAITLGRIPHVILGGQRIRMNTVLTMGLGHTFPLQTLVFYCLLKAIGGLKGSHGTVSVYGDDLIYPRSIHKLVGYVFPRLHLILNEDKTYAKDFFRESCGSDYYRGCDVRPFCLEAEHHHCSGVQYERLLYKLYNGLLRRWDREEIPGTIEWITQELILKCDRILCVPTSFPDSSGIRVEQYTDGYFHAPLEDCYPYQSKWFHYLMDRPKRRKVWSQMIYYWESLRSKESKGEYSPYDDPTDSPQLTWKRERRVVEGRRVFVLIPTVAAKQRSATELARASTSLYWALSQSPGLDNEISPPARPCGSYPTRNPVVWARRVGWRGWPLT
jgi:hypothetical protein